MGFVSDLLGFIAGTSLIIGVVAACVWFAVWAVKGLVGALG